MEGLSVALLQLGEEDWVWARALQKLRSDMIEEAQYRVPGCTDRFLGLLE